MGSCSKKKLDNKWRKVEIELESIKRQKIRTIKQVWKEERRIPGIIPKNNNDLPS